MFPKIFNNKEKQEAEKQAVIDFLKTQKAINSKLQQLRALQMTNTFLLIGILFIAALTLKRIWK